MNHWQVACMLFKQGSLYRRSQDQHQAVYWIGLLALFAVIPLGVLSSWVAAASLVGVVLVGAVLMFWTNMLTSFARMHGAAQIKLVPAYRRQGKQFIMLCTALLVVVISVPFLMMQAPSAACLLVGSLYCLSLTASLSGSNGFGMCYSVAATLSMLLGRRLIVLDWQAYTPCFLLLTALVWMLAYKRVFIEDGARADTHVDRLLKATLPQGQASLGLPAYLGGSLYRRMLQRDCATPGQAPRLLMHVLGPRLHWSAGPMMVLGFAAICMLVVYVLRAYDAVNSLVVIVVGVLLIFGVVIGAVAAAGLRMRATAGEQSLFMLSARRPPRSAINRLLARGLVGHVLRQGLSALVGAAAVAYVAQCPDLPMLLVAAGAAFVLAPRILLNFARNCTPLGWTAWPLVLLAAVLVIAGMGLYWPFSVAAAIVLSAAIGLRRYQKMLAAPIAFPAARRQAV